ncbi:MAG TPA: CopG family transcriptional regulator [Thermodesulfobacteriota bacterium]|nr:CopG family transcriptional regulator [Thermodesulfobacteriota bacterium]
MSNLTIEVQMVEKRILPNRSEAIQRAIKNKLTKMKRGRLLRECTELDRQFEQTLAKEGIDHELKTWPEY